MSPKKTSAELEEEAVKRKVNKMYENYGIDVANSDESDLSRVYRHYKANPKQLETDLQRSKEHAGKFDDEESL